MHIEVWCEKDALTSVIHPVCQEFGVTFAALRGFDSESFAYESACDLRATGKPSIIYYFGDHDPSGWWIARNLEATLRGFGANATVRHAAVFPEQIALWKLPQRYAKRSDKRLKGFVQHFGSDLCTEVDAIPPDRLQTMVRRCIQRNIEWAAWQQAQHIEGLERETLESVAAIMQGVKAGTRFQLGSEAAQ